MRRGLLISGLLVLAVAAAIGLAAAWFERSLDQPLAIPGDEYVLDVPPGSPLKAVAARLAADGVLKQPLLLELHARRSGLHRQVRAGEYAVFPGTSLRELLELLVSGRVKLHPVTLVEGWTIAELLRALQRHPVLTTTLEDSDPERLAASLGLDWPHAEGLFFPDTYLVSRGTTDAELLRRAHRVMRERLDQLWQQRPADLPLADPYEMLILASIIERETALDSERSQVAGVFIRRLRLGMRLQTDPTVIYGLGDGFSGALTRRQLAEDTPWNTYTRSGLPPTPIGLPGEASLRAAITPDDGQALYFVATGLPDGSHQFSRTLDEHNAAVRRYRERLRERQ